MGQLKICPESSGPAKDLSGPLGLLGGPLGTVNNVCYLVVNICCCGVRSERSIIMDKDIHIYECDMS